MRPFHITALISALFLCACATSRPAVEWARTKDSAPPYEEARRICEKKALAVSSEIPGLAAEAAAAKAAGGVYLKCMRDIGWEQRYAPEP